LLLSNFVAAAQTKQIQLRNETITTTPAAKMAPAARFQAQGCPPRLPRPVFS